MKSPTPVLQLSGRSRLPRFVFLAFLILACFALAQQASAQDSLDIVFDGRTHTFTIADAVVTEGAGPAGFTVTVDPLLPDNLDAVTFDVVYTARSASFADLVSPRAETFVFARGASTRIFEVPINDDGLVEGEEIFTVTLEVREVGTENMSANGTIIDNDGTRVSLALAEPMVTEGGTFSFTVSLSEAVDEFVNLSWALTGTGSSPATVTGPGSDLGDRQASAGLMSFPPNDNADRTITVTTRDDNLVEDDETLTMTLSGNLPDGVRFGTTTFTATIVDGDAATVSIALEEPRVVEGGAFSFEVLLSRAIDEAVTVPWTAAGTGSSPATLTGDASDLRDGEATDGMVTFLAGETAAQLIALTTRADELAEGDETFTVTLNGDGLPDGVRLGTAAATATIANALPPTVSIALAEPTVVEGGTFSFEVLLSRAVDEPVTVSWAAAGTGGSPATMLGDSSDLRDGQTISSTVTFAAGSIAAQTVTIATRDDDVVESAETFTVTLSGDLPDGVVLGTQTAIGTIADNEPGLSTAIRIADAAAVAESGVARFTIGLEPRALVGDAVLNVAYAADSATLEDLGRNRPATVTIPARSRSVVLEVPIAADETVEGEESFTVTLSAAANQPNDPETGFPPNFVLLFPRARATGTIAADEAPSPVDDALVSIADADPVAEDAGAARFTVNLSRAVDTDVVLDVAYAAGSAVLADLGTPRPTTVTIPANGTEANVDVPIFDDAIVEGDETFTVTIAAAGTLPAGVSLSPTATRATGSILDDDIQTGLSIDDARVTEGGVLRFAYNLSQAATSPVVFTYATADGTATVADADYTPQPDGRVTIAALTTEGVLEVPTTADAVVEADETLTVRLTGARQADGGPVTLLDEVVTGTIENDDVGVVSIAPPAVVAAEGETASFEVRLDRAVAAAVTVRWTVAGAGSRPATLTGAASDLAAEVATSGEVTFAARDTAPKPFTIATRTDTLVEGDEAFEVTLVAESLPAAVRLDREPATGTITDLTSVLMEPRRIGAATALRRHLGRFEIVTSAVIQGRLDGRTLQKLNVSDTPGDGAMAIGGGFAETGLGAWADGAYAGFQGRATGRQADIYGGVDYRGGNGNWLIGALVGQDFVALEVGEASYRANYTHVGPYGGVRLSQRLVFDGAATYGIATPEVQQGDVSASYDASRITLRGGLTGDVGLTYGLGGGMVRVRPQVNVGWARENLGRFTDSAGGIAASETLELGRLSAGPRVTWDMDGKQLVGGARLQWDFVQPDDIAASLSTVVDIGLQFDLTADIQVGLSGDIDGIGIADDFMTFGGGIQLRFNLTRSISMALVGDIDEIGTLDGSSNRGGKFELTIGR